MSMMRLYEFSRMCGVSSKELIAALKNAGFSVSSHMAMLSPEERDFLEKTFVKEKKPTKKAVAKKSDIASKESERKPVQQTIEHKEKSRGRAKKAYVNKVAKPLNIAEKIKEPGVALEPISLIDFADASHNLPSDVILTLLKMGIAATKNQILSTDVVEKLAHHYQIPIIKAERSAVEVIKGIEGREGEFKGRVPVVVVLGHVDHGKTTLLDYVRETRVAAKEKGGITQHLGAYEAKTPQGNIIFIDTPGHEAFTKIRGRGIGVADIAVLIVAADDGMMPQTLEAIRYIKESGVPLIVGINKIDKADPSRIEVIKRELAQQDLLPEDWGGNIICAPISAKTGEGVEHLLEMIILQAELMELEADASGKGVGHVLEAKLEKGRGPVGTVLGKHGNIKVGDYFIAGNVVGKVSSIVDSFGKRLSHVGPTLPVQIAGFNALPEVGAVFQVVNFDEYRQAKNALSSQRTFAARSTTEGALNLVIKTDTLSSKEALLESIEKLEKKIGHSFNIVFAGIGDITEGDVVLALTTGASIITLHTRPETNAALLARNNGVSIAVFDIIYKLLEDLADRAEKEKPIEKVWQKIGEAIVRQVFEIKNIGVIAGCYVRDGRFTKDGKVVVSRHNKKIGEGKITSLQRERKTVKEVHAGFECGFMADGLTDFQVDDHVECLIEVAATGKKS